MDFSSRHRLLCGMLAGVFMLGLFSGCSQSSPDASGETLFDEHCSGCHGSRGQGRFLLGVPANRNTQLSYWEIKIKISHGSGKDSDMPVFSHLTDIEVSKIASYLQQMNDVDQ